jgi:hypothetical protein
MIIMGYGISLDVEHLNYAVLDRDQTTISRDYLINVKGSSRYFTERPPIASYEELDSRMKSGEVSMAIEIPPNFGRDVDRWNEGDKPVSIGVWIDGAMPQRAETIRGYVNGMHLLWLQDVARYQLGQRQQLGVGQRQLVAPANIELRYRYNPDVKSLVAMVPAVIPLLLLLIPAMLATLSVSARRTLVRSSISMSRRLPAWSSFGKQLPTCSRCLTCSVCVFETFKVHLKELAAAVAPFYTLLTHGDRTAHLDPDAPSALFATAVLSSSPPAIPAD